MLRSYIACRVRSVPTTLQIDSWQVQVPPLLCNGETQRDVLPECHCGAAGCGGGRAGARVLQAARHFGAGCTRVRPNSVRIPTPWWLPTTSVLARHMIHSVCGRIYMPCTQGALNQMAVHPHGCRAVGIGLSRGSDSDVSPGLTCKEGYTVQIGTLDAAQNPSCVKCGGQSQFACSESPNPP